ncbi:MAG: hypothetical protein ACXVA9_10480 [Bdellovibrionales bacterium]
MDLLKQTTHSSRDFVFHVLLAGLLILSPRIWAQDPPRFQPPRPPPMDQDFEDPAEDELENGDAPNRAVVPPATVGSPQPAAPPVTDFRPAQPVPSAADQSKVKFKVVDGEFYEKGKKRGRTSKNTRQ